MATPASKTPTSRVETPDPRHFATPGTPNVQTENTVDATRTEGKDHVRKQQAAPKAKPEHNTTELPVPGDSEMLPDDAGQGVDTPPVSPKGQHAASQEAPQGEKLEAVEPVISPQTEQRIERDLEVAATTGEVKPRSTIAPAKPAREPNEDEQRMAEDFDPPPLAHRPDVGT